MSENVLLHSWNVNGLRAAIRKGLEAYVAEFSPDVLCLQEIKCPADLELPDSLRAAFPHRFLHPADKPGYSGTAIFSRFPALSVSTNFDAAEDHPQEGRVLSAEFPGVTVVCAYVPNAQNELARLDYRLRWDRDFREHLKTLAARKPVAVCGDFNCAHKPIDLANPKSNERNPGFTIEERDSFSETLDAGFVDTFRAKNPTAEKAYSWWSYRMKARERNVGWRIDYWLVSRALESQFSAPGILPQVLGSDHCPVSVELPRALFEA
ncbi:MAG: exodeoxyribonuclease III [Candidatus Spyradosoma sp.]